tara:strand:- start:2868 stop:3098 length:231 start_codon:yes stop_codon:yes gene_type:complete
MNDNMSREKKAEYYDWLMKQYQVNENQISRIPKLSIEEQSKSATVSEPYSQENLELVNNLKERLQKIEAECQRIMI